MSRSKKSFIFINIISLFVAGLLCITLYAYMQYKGENPVYTVCSNMSYSNPLLLDEETSINTEDDASITKNIKYVSSSSYHLDVSISKEWIENKEKCIRGAQYDIVFYNDTNKDMSDWVIQIPVPAGNHLDSFWNGDYLYEDSTITIRPLDYNQTIGSGKEITLGFVLMTQNSTCQIKDAAIVFYYKEEIWDYAYFWIILVYLIVLFLADIIYLVTYTRINRYNKRRKEDLRIIDQSLITFANIIDAKDVYTRGHSLRVAIYAKEIARRMGISGEAQQMLYYIALLHDIGKIGIPDNILNKPGSLTEEERKIIQKHSTIGGSILKDFNSIPGIAEGAMYHHERYDGKGYDTGLSGNDIPLFARIICVADAFDAMSSARCYRKKLTKSKIIQEIVDNAGAQFDPAITKHILDMIEDDIIPVTVKAEEDYTYKEFSYEY